MIVRVKGGPGSGHHGHRGRPGLRGGSLPGKGGKIDTALIARKVLKVVYGGKAVEPNANELGVVANMLKRHPHNVVGHIKSIVLCSSEEDWKEQYDRVFSIFPDYVEGEHLECGGFFDPKTYSIYLPPGFSVHAFDHEIGHIVARESRAKGKYNVWYNKYTEYGWFDRHTAYARTHHEEGFAESYAAWIGAGRVSDYDAVTSNPALQSFTAEALDKYYQTFVVVREVVESVQ